LIILILCQFGKMLNYLLVLEMCGVDSLCKIDLRSGVEGPNVKQFKLLPIIISWWIWLSRNFTIFEDKSSI
jgi:hypothetical protein